MFQFEYLFEQDCNSSIESDTRRLESNKSFNRSYPGTYSKEELDKNRLEIENEKALLEKCKRIGDSLGSGLDDIASYLYSFRMRGNNKMGGKVLQDYYVQTGAAPTYVIYNMATDAADLIVAPGTLPGLNPFSINANY